MLQDPHYFVKAHQKMGQGNNENYTTMRILYYPPLPPSSEIKPGQLRCGEHVDYGSITLLFQDPIRGLQVSNLSLSLSFFFFFSLSFFFFFSLSFFTLSPSLPTSFSLSIFNCMKFSHR